MLAIQFILPRFSGLILAGAFLLRLTSPATAQVAPLYHYELLPLVGMASNVPFGINDKNVITGIAAGEFAGMAALWTGQRAVSLGNGEDSRFAQGSANDINDRNLIAGSTSFASDQPQHAAFFINRNWVDAGTGFPDPSSFSTFRAINNSGFGAGQRAASTPSVRSEAFFWRNGVFTTITLGGKSGQA